MHLIKINAYLFSKLRSRERKMLVTKLNISISTYTEPPLASKFLYELWKFVSTT